MITADDLRGKLAELRESRDNVQAEIEKQLKNLNAHDGAIEVVQSLLEKASAETGGD